jgi:hypothetical protein
MVMLEYIYDTTTQKTTIFWLFSNVLEECTASFLKAEVKRIRKSMIWGRGLGEGPGQLEWPIRTTGWEGPVVKSLF